MKIDLSGKVALVTGASAGIGSAIAIRLAEAGAKVAVNYNKSQAQAEEVVQAIRSQGGTADPFQADVTSIEQIERLVQQVEAAFGTGIDILVNNAGHMLERRPNLEMTEDLYDQVMDLNVKSTVFMCKAALPGMIAKGGGSIVNMTSVAAHNGGGPGSTVYSASKAAVLAYTKGLAKEVGPRGVRVNNVSPGFIGNTRFHAALTTEASKNATIASTPLGRQGEPDDVAGAVLYLASDLSSYLTGETIEINGGNFMR
jgi:3-oxoacyl-[acyl-carrier protein] reductase